MADRPLQCLSIATGERVIFDEASLTQVARCQQLQELSVCFDAVHMSDQEQWKDWTDAAVFTSFPARCLARLRSIKLQYVSLSAASLVAIASAAPQLQVIRLKWVELSCHTAIMCAIFGGYCEQTQEIKLTDAYWHVWDGVHTTEVVNAYQSAVQDAGRGDRYKPFTQLRHLRAIMCWCTPPAVWHALLSLMRHATDLNCVAKLTSNDPLTIAALMDLPSFKSLGSDCLWPLSFVTFMEQKYVHTGRYRYLAARAVIGRQYRGGPEDGPTLELANRTVGEGPVILRRRSSLFASFRQSLCKTKRAVLARWARGNFHDDDEQLTGLNRRLEEDEEDGLCPYPLRLFSRM